MRKGRSRGVVVVVVGEEEGGCKWVVGRAMWER